MARTNSDIADKPELPEKRGRGGTKGKGSRPKQGEAMGLHTEPGDNQRYLAHSMQMWDWPAVSMMDADAVKARVGEYFKICEKDDMKPSVSGLAFALGIDRRRLWEITRGVRGTNKITHEVAPETRDVLKRAYNILTMQMENYMQNGKINPVAGIFLMKNNMDYADKQEIVLSPNSGAEDAATPEQLQEKYLQTVEADYEVIE